METEVKTLKGQIKSHKSIKEIFWVHCNKSDRVIYDQNEQV